MAAHMNFPAWRDGESRLHHAQAPCAPHHPLEQEGGRERGVRKRASPHALTLITHRDTRAAAVSGRARYAGTLNLTPSLASAQSNRIQLCDSCEIDCQENMLMISCNAAMSTWPSSRLLCKLLPRTQRKVRNINEYEPFQRHS